MDMDRILYRVRDEAMRFYGSRLISLAVYGSVARGTATEESDIDLLVIASPLPDGRIPRIREFDAVEKALEPDLEKASAAGFPAILSPIFKTPQEANRLGSIFLDMTLERVILYDRDEYLKALLDDLARRLAEKRAVRRKQGDFTYWILVPALNPGENWQRSTGQELSRKFLYKSRRRVKALHTLMTEEDWSDVVREAQEIVELCAKGMLRAIGIDPPRQHDVAPLLVANAERLPEAVREALPGLAEASKALRKEREFAFYGDDDFLPVEEYGADQARWAFGAAAEAVRLAEAVIRV